MEEFVVDEAIVINNTRLSKENVIFIVTTAVALPEVRDFLKKNGYCVYFAYDFRSYTS